MPRVADSSCKPPESVITRLETWFDLYKKKLTSSKRILIQKMIDEYGTGKIDKDFNEQTKKYLLSYSNNIKKLMRIVILLIL